MNNSLPHVRTIHNSSVFNATKNPQAYLKIENMPSVDADQLLMGSDELKNLIKILYKLKIIRIQLILVEINLRVMIWIQMGLKKLLV